MEISHLLFADDTLIMCDVVTDQIHNLGLILLVFRVILGLKVNLRKSKLVTVGEVLHKEELVGILSVSISSLLFLWNTWISIWVLLLIKSHSMVHYGVYL